MATVEILGIKIEVDDGELGKLQAGLEKAGVATTKLGESSEKAAQGTRRLADAHDDASKRASDHKEKQTSLGNALGTNERQTEMLVQSIADMSGVSGVAGQAISALASGMSVTAVAVVGLATVVGLAKQAMEEHVATLHAEATALAQTDVALGEYVQKTQELRVEQAALNYVQDYFTKGAGAAGMAMADAVLNAEKYAQAELRIGQVMRTAIQGNLEEMATRAATAKTAGDHAAAILALAQAYAPLNYAGKEWKDLADIQRDAMIKLAEGNSDYARLMSAAANVTVTFVDEGMRAAGVVDDIGEAMKRTQALVDNSKALKDGGGPTFEDMSTVDPEEWRRANQRSRDAADMRDKIDKWNKEKQLNDARIADAKREAEALAGYQKMVADASTVASDQVRAGFDMISNSALTAAEKTALLRQYISTLPENVRTRLELAISTHADALLMQLLGGRLPSPNPRNRQATNTGNQWEFTLGGEGYAVQQEWFNKYGNYDLANAAWQEAHRKELAAKGVPNEDPQFAEGGIVTRPMRAIVGEAGPEAIIPLDRMGGFGGDIILNFTNNVYGISTAQEEEVRPMILPMLERAIYEINRRK